MPLFDLMWSMLAFFLLVAWIWVVVGVIADIFRSDDLGGAAKAFWVLFVILIPWLGVLIYIITNGDRMAMRSLEAAEERDAATRAYIQDAAGASTADEIKKLADLKSSGVISDAAFEAQKAKLLG